MLTRLRQSAAKRCGRAVLAHKKVKYSAAHVCVFKRGNNPYFRVNNCAFTSECDCFSLSLEA